MQAANVVLDRSAPQLERVTSSTCLWLPASSAPLLLTNRTRDSREAAAAAAAAAATASAAAAGDDDADVGEDRRRCPERKKTVVTRCRD